MIFNSFLILAIFLFGYFLIIIEGIVKFNKAATALLMSIGCWAFLFYEPSLSLEKHELMLAEQMYKVSQVLFFLLGALAIVEIINAHKGFRLITKHLFIPSKRRLLWSASIATFFLSSILDNLTTTIVMVTLIAKIVQEKEERLLLGGMVVIAANAGGAWTPIGDIATTLLWINGEVTALPLIRNLFLPSFLGLLAALFWFTGKFKGEFKQESTVPEQPEPYGTFILFFGVGCLIFAPIFKVLTGLPPFMGILFGLGLMWIITDILHFNKKERDHLKVAAILPRVEISLLLFYLGILLSIYCLESAGLLKGAASWLNQHLPNTMFIPLLVGFASSIVDNVSLVAATTAMYDLNTYHVNSAFWMAIAYSAGVGGSLLIIGSAAGVAFMALEKANFLWYVKKISFPAFLTLIVGMGSFYSINSFL